MKHDDLINAMGNIDEKLVAAAAPGVRRKHHRPLWYAVIAACAAAVIAVSLLVPRFGVQNAPPAEQSTPATTTTVAPSQTEMTTTTTATQATTAAPTTASTPLHTSQKGTTTPSVAVTTTAPSTAYTQRPTKVVVFQNYYSTRLQAPEGSLPSRSLDPETKTLRSVTGFCFDIVRELYNGENMVVAPLPTYIQLAMLRHDRDAETRAQIEELLGIDPETGDAQLRSLIDKIVYDANGSYTKMANSLWFKGDSKSEEFLTNAIGYYDAEIFACKDMDDNTCAEINNWVASKTDNLIPKLLDKLSPTATMNMVSTLVTAAKWGGEATEQQGVFYNLDGTESPVTYLKLPSNGWGIDSYMYQVAVRSMGQCTLYLIEPKEGTSIADVLEPLSYTFLSDPRLYGGTYHKKCYITLPRFQCEYAADLTKPIQKMGLTGLFDTGKNAEFVSRILSKAFFETSAEGVRGAAASSIETAVRGPSSDAPMYMKADRPFVYILADADTNIPLLIGTQTAMS